MMKFSLLQEVVDPRLQYGVPWSQLTIPHPSVSSDLAARASITLLSSGFLSCYSLLAKCMAFTAPHPQQFHKSPLAHHNSGTCDNTDLL